MHNRMCARAVLDRNCTSTTDYTCKVCRGRSSCPSNHHSAGNCGGHSDFSCTACPAHAESPAGATEASQCTCAANFYDGDTAAQGVKCISCRTSCDSASEYVSTKCGAVDAAHGVDASCSTCPAHSTLKAQSGRRLFSVHGSTAPLIQDCACGGGYFDDELALSRVHCATVPPGFGSTYTSTTCQFSKFGLGATRCLLRNLFLEIVQDNNKLRKDTIRITITTRVHQNQNDTPE